jgi:long-chain acyl-CoA synthetase
MVQVIRHAALPGGADVDRAVCRDWGSDQVGADEAVSASHSPVGGQIVRAVIRGRECPAFAQRPPNLGCLLKQSTAFEDRDYIVDESGGISFAGHHAMVERAAQQLRELGVRSGDRIMFSAAPSADWVIAFWAVVRIGAIATLPNLWWSDAQLRDATALTNPRVVLTDEDAEGTVRRAAGELRSPVRGLSERAGVTAAGSYADPPVDEDAPAAILFTSGTTGAAKPVTLSHRGLINSTLALARRAHHRTGLPAPPLTAHRALMSLPLFHIGGLQLIMNSMLSGRAIVLLSGRFDPDRVVAMMRAKQITSWSAVPTMVARVIERLDLVGGPPITSIRTISMGGAKVPERLKQETLLHFPNARSGVGVTYGLTEAGGVVTASAGAAIRSRPGAVGRPLDTTELRIDGPDDEGNGEIAVNSPSLMLGYWTPDGLDRRTPDLTPASWLRTGDLGHIDADGYLYITGRKKDVVIRGGENIDVATVEAALLDHSAVAEAAVLGIPHPTLGEELAAAVSVRRGHHVTQAELERHLRARLASFEIPRRWWLTPDPLPANPSGKNSKADIRRAWPAQ